MHHLRGHATGCNITAVIYPFHYESFRGYATAAGNATYLRIKRLNAHWRKPTLFNKIRHNNYEGIITG